MLRRPFSFIFLEYNHALLPTNSQKQPRSFLVSKTFFEAEYVSLERFK
jgi:hypothetical protein